MTLYIYVYLYVHTHTGDTGNYVVHDPLRVPLHLPPNPVVNILIGNNFLLSILPTASIVNATADQFSGRFQPKH